MKRKKYKRLKHLARLFLMWFETDGEPVDGFRFREQFHALAKEVKLEKWYRKLLPSRGKRKNRA